MRPRLIILAVLLPLVAYFGLYTWNARTGVVDRLTAVLGLDAAGWVFRPGRAVERGVRDIWERYIYLVGVRQENEDLRAQVHALREEVVRLREQAAEARRLANLLNLPEPQGWERQGARVVAHRPGPGMALDALVVDVGLSSGVRGDAPVCAAAGLVGRVARSGQSFSVVTLITAPTSRVPVVSQDGRIPGVVCGQGPDAPVEVRYVPLGQQVREGEILVTSGMDGRFPRGIPVARVTAVAPSADALFQKVTAQPVVDMAALEEVVVLRRPEPPSANETRP
ncbi:MAG: rod shape-determining protein MreC [Desulfomicrobiaceae bacterium]